MYKKIMSLFVVVLLMGMVSGEIGSDVRENDDGIFLQLWTAIPQQLIDWLVNFPQVNSGEIIAGFTYLYLADGQNLALVQDVGYLLSLRNEMLRASNLFIAGYEYPDFCKRHPDTGQTFGVYFNLTTDTFEKVLDDPKCPT